MFVPAKLVFKSYMPRELEKGMFFLQRMNDGDYNYMQIRELDQLPRDQDHYMEINGAPVEPYIVAQMLNPDDSEIVLADPEQIGWYDPGDYSEDLMDIDVKIINMILEEWNGDIAIEMMEDDEFEGDAVILFYNKVTIRTIDNVSDEEDDDEEEYEEEMCSFCNGTGEGSHPDATCPICGGEGVRKFYYEEDPD